jgi:hypothetical protein
MSKYQDYANKPREFLALTGYTRTEFDALLSHFTEQFYEHMKQYRLDGKPRGKRRYSDYQNSPLPTPADKLFFILNYLKTNNLQEVQGAMFGISQPKANQWIHTLRVVLQQTLTCLNEMPARSMEAVVFDEDNTLYFHDGTERPIPRPTDSAKQKEFYSGKKNYSGKINLFRRSSRPMRYVSGS